MKLAFILCVLVIGVAITSGLFYFRKKENTKLSIFLAVVTCLVSITILAVPLMEYDNPYTRIFAAFIYATKCIGFGQNLGVLSQIPLNSMLGYLYFILINILFLALPSLSLSFVITYLEKLVTYIRIKMAQNKKILIFSEINEKSLSIAKNMKGNCAIIFANVINKTDIDIKSIKTNKNVLDIKISPKSDVTFYIVYNDDERSLNETLELIDKYKDRDKTKVYLISKSDEAPTILDSTDKGKISLEIINEKERIIFDLLNDKPLFLNSVNDTISILIVGCGDVGQEFLKDSIWCGMMPGYKLKVLVVDINADIIRENINIESPELLDNYDIKFINEDIKSKKALDAIKARKDINYILVSMENVEKNLDMAIILRRLFLREFNREPIINIYIDNKYKNEQVSKLSNERGISYNINAFGNIDKLYERFSAFGSELEQLAIKVHLSYDPNDKDLHRYNLREYSKRSSRAFATHVKYNLYAVLKDRYTGNLKDDLKLFKEIYSDDIENLLSICEHDRWVAYMRSIGYVLASTSEVSKYYKKTKNYIHFLARMHPALVKYDDLDKVSKELSKIMSKNIDLKSSDKTIIRFLYELDL